MKLISYIILFVLTSPAFSQSNDIPKREITIVAYTNSGARYLDKIVDLNQALAAANTSLPSFNNILYVSESGIGTGVKKWYFLFLDRRYTISQSLKYPSTTGNGNGQELRIHYKLVRHKGFNLYPFFGIGGQNINTYFDTSVQPFAISIQNSLNKSGTSQSLKLSTKQVTLSFGFLLDFKIATLYKNLDLFIGGNVCYVAVIRNDEFRVNDQLTDYSKGSFGGLDMKLAATLSYRLFY